jgi:thiamine-monophosphate kinase
MDCSDGVIQDIEKLIPPKLGFKIHADRLPISSALNDYAKSKAWKYALTGGEDYGLLMTCSTKNETTIVKKFQEKRIKITQIGEVTKMERKIYLDQKELKRAPATFQHF